ncbi:MAG: hypothetical protein ABIR52_12495, partial [Casimicrobiaceae bacterium]
MKALLIEALLVEGLPAEVLLVEVLLIGVLLEEWVVCEEASSKRCRSCWARIELGGPKASGALLCRNAPASSSARRSRVRASMKVGMPMYDPPELRQTVDLWWSGLARALRAEGIAEVPERLDRGVSFDALWSAPDLLFA